MENKNSGHVLQVSNLVNASILIADFLSKTGSDVMDALGMLSYLADSLKDVSYFRNTSHWHEEYKGLFSPAFTKYTLDVKIAQNVVETVLADTNALVKIGFYERHINADFGKAVILDSPYDKKGTYGIIICLEGRGSHVAGFRKGRPILQPATEVAARIHYSNAKTAQYVKMMGQLPKKARDIVPARQLPWPAMPL